MVNKLLGAAAIAAIAFTAAPVSAASMAGCSGENMQKAESAVEVMAEGEGKMTAQKEIAMAQNAMLDGKMGACATHLNHALHREMMK